MQKETTEICLIAPTDEVARKSKLIIGNYHKEINVYQASLGDAAALAKKLSQKGAKIFISRRGTKSSIEQVFNGQTVEIEQVLADYIPIMDRILKEKHRVAFIRYGLMPEDVRTMCQMLHIDALYYSFSTLEECEKAVKEAVKDGATLAVGGADSARFAALYGLPHTVAESSESSLLRAITTAEQLLEIKKEEEEKQKKLRVLLERYEMIFNFTHDAIAAADEHGKIVVINEPAELFFELKSADCEGKDIDQVFPNTHMKKVLTNGHREFDHLLNIHDKMVSANYIPIIVDDVIYGVVATFQDVKMLQSSEQKIRLKLHKKGLIAKYHFEDIIGTSAAIKTNLNLAEKFARSNATVLLNGETGTGKELFAQSIHNASPRAKGPFVAINCGALPKNLLEAELFGYEEGAFTGAMKGGKSGLFETAHGGTAFLDEIGEMPLDMQVQLLRVLQEKEVRRIGSDRVIPVNIRIIAATHKDLLSEVRKGNFREDLYYRLNVLNLLIPPLRDRKEDVPLIGLNIYSQMKGMISPEEQAMIKGLLKRISYYNWPGNVRELHNLIERIYVLLAAGEDMSFIEQYICSYLELEEKQIPENACNLEDWERDQILTALKENNLEIIKTAEALGISRGTLWRKMKKYNIQI